MKKIIAAFFILTLTNSWASEIALADAVSAIENDFYDSNTIFVTIDNPQYVDLIVEKLSEDKVPFQIVAKAQGSRQINISIQTTKKLLTTTCHLSIQKVYDDHGNITTSLTQSYKKSLGNGVNACTHLISDSVNTDAF